MTNVAMFLFIARHTGHWSRTTVTRAVAFLAIPVLGHTLAWRDGLGVFESMTFARAYELTYIANLQFGGLYLLTTAYHFALVMVGMAFAAQFVRRGGAMARGQGAALFAAMGVPALVNVLVLSDAVPRVFDIMPLGHAVAAGALFWGVYRHQMLDLAPVARHALVDALQDGMLIVDGDDRIVDANAEMVTNLGVPFDVLVGRPLVDVPTGPIGDALRSVAVAARPDPAGADVPVTAAERRFDLRTLAVAGTPARVLVLHDVTARQRLEDEQARLIAELQDALGHVKTLTGLLPICAGCKQIRDALGRWQPMETYIRDRTDAEFSHGMCPVCMAQWFPEGDADQPPS